MREYECQIALEDVLAVKEKRAQVQQEMLRQYKMPLVSISVNMPGSIKYSADTIALLRYGMEQLREVLGENGIFAHEERVYHWLAGPTALMAVEGDARDVKRHAIVVENTGKAGRLLDIDVFDGDGKLLSRDDFAAPRRTCLVCERPAVECVRSRTHNSDDVLTAVKRLLTDFQSVQTELLPPPVVKIGSKAVEAMLMEVACSPAPGLVDRFNAGAHDDMDFFSFIKSSTALANPMFRCALAGWNHKGPLADMLPVLRQIGQAGEQQMFQATAGVNTQKGLLFLLGMLAAAAGWQARQENSGLMAKAILNTASQICSGVVERELVPLQTQLPQRKLTAGERLYLSYGVSGIRGEVEAGLPAVQQYGLPALQQALTEGLTLNDALVQTLLAIMTYTEDTTILNRHNMVILKEVQRRAGELLAAGGMKTTEGQALVEAFDQELIQRRISPGGSADLLAATYFLYALDSHIDK